MKNLKSYLLFLSLIIFAAVAKAQSADSLVAQGTRLHDQRKYAEAIALYKQALLQEPNNSTALYELSYSLYTNQQGKEAVTYLEKLIHSNKPLAGAYDLLGNIYDEDKQPEKAIATYQQGIKLNPQYQRLHYNLALTLYQVKRYAESEAEIITAMKLEPTHASSQRLYGFISQSRNRSVPALMAFCNFLLLEPNTERSKATYEVLQNVFKSKVTRTGEKSINLNVLMLKDGNSDMNALELALSMAAVSPTLEKNQNKTPVELLENQLEQVFMIAGEQAAQKKGKDFFWNYYASYFHRLAKSGNLPAFTRYISLSTYKDECLKWFEKNDKALDELDAWLKNNPHQIN